MVLGPLVAAMSACRADGASHLESTALQVLAGIRPDVILAATAREPELGPSQTVTLLPAMGRFHGAGSGGCVPCGLG